MKKFFSLFVLCFCVATALFARTQQEAAELAGSFFGERINGVTSSNIPMRRLPSAKPSPVELAFIQHQADSITPALYIFNASDDEGFVLVSAKDEAKPILGYADTGAFDQGNIPANMQFWLQMYADELASVDKNNSNKSTVQRISLAEEENTYPAVEPILGNVKWNQDEPYNNFCPTISGYQSPSGCVATAMAQIMYKHQYPNKGTGSHSYVSSTYGLSLSANFGNTTYDWANMLPSYNESYTTTQANAVATLLSHVGIAAEMDYGPRSSGAYSDDAMRALIEHFGYDKGITILKKDYMTEHYVLSQISADLQKGFPVYISGSTVNSEGHAFVCDGMQADGYMHINWGWGGSSNGYFALSALDPDNQGIGGSSGDMAYTQVVAIYTNIQPNIGGTSTSLMTVSSLKRTSANKIGRNDKVQFALANFLNQSLFNTSGTFAYHIYNADEKVAEVALSSFDLGPNYYYSAINLSQSIPSNLPTGDYELEIVYTDQSGNVYPVFVKGYGIMRIPMTISNNNITFYDGDSSSVLPFQNAEITYVEGTNNWNIDFSSMGFWEYEASDIDVLLRCVIHSESNSSIIGSYVLDANNSGNPGTIDANPLYAVGYSQACYQYTPQKLYITIAEETNGKLLMQYYMEVNNQVLTGVQRINPIWTYTDGSNNYYYNEHITNELAATLSTSNALAFVNNVVDTEDIEMNCFVKGVISDIEHSSQQIAQQKTASFDISDSGNNTGTLYCSNARWLNNTDFISGNEIHVGDSLVVYGNLQKNGTTPQLNGYIYECNQSSIADGYNILYTSYDGNIVTPYATDVFGANIISNTYENGQGVITFDGPVTSIGYRAFNACMTLKSIIIPNSVMTIGESAFNICNNLTAITIGKGVTSIDARAFQPVRLTSIVVDAENPIYDSRDNCNAIIETATNTLIQGCQKTVIAQSVTHIGEWAFEFCEYLSSITIPNSVISIGEYAFNNCKSLTSVTIPNSVTSIGLAAFSSCDKLTSMIVDTANPVYDSRENCNAIIETSTNTLIAGCSNTIIPQSVIHIGEYAFSSCNISSITIPNSVTTIGKYAFAYSDIASITIPNSVTTIGENAFNSSSLTSFTIPNSVKDIERWVFANCSSLNSITLHDGITTIGEGAFINCSSLTSVIIPNSVTSIRTGAFSFCKSLTSIVVDSGNTTYDSRENCNAIIETGSNTLIAGCQNTIIPNSVTKIYLEAFRGCSTLTAITIPNSVTSIGGWAFNDCSSLASIVIPNSVTRIEQRAFYNCSLLDTIYVEATTPPTLQNNTVFTGTPSPTCIVPCGTLAAYQASEWANQVGEFVEEECEETKEITVKAHVPASWTDQITAWVWHTGGEGREVVPTKDGDWYVVTENCAELNIIYKNGAGWNGNVNQTMDMTFSENTCIDITANAGTLATYTIVDCIDTDSASGVIFDPEVDKGNASSDSNSAAAYSVTKNGVTMNVSTGIVGTTNNITHYRIYKGQTLTLSSTVGNIVSVEFSCTSTGDYGPAGFTTTTGTYDYLDATGTWTGNASKIVFTATNNQVRASKITVTLESDSLPTQEVVDCIYYTSTDGNIVTPYTPHSGYIPPFGSDDDIVGISSDSSDGDTITPDELLVFGAKIISNTYQNGQGVIAFDRPVEKIGDYAFSSCSSLTSITIPNSVTSLGYHAFANCNALDNTYVKATTPPVLDATAFYSISPTCIVPCGTLAAYQASDWANQVGELVEEECEETKEITVKARVPASWTDSIFVWVWPTGGEGVELIPEKQDDWYVFTQKGEELNIIFKNGRGWMGYPYQTEDITLTESACLQIYTDNNEDLKATYTFIDCNSVNPNHQILYTSLDGKIVTPFAADVFGADIISNTYENGHGVITFDGPVTSIGDYAFNECNQLWTITLPESVTRIGNSAFDQCVMLSSINLPESIISIGSQAFFYCIALNEIIIPKSVTSIEYGTFNQCSSLRTITIHENITSIGNQAFERCSYLDTIYVEATIPPTLGSYAFDNRSSVCFVPCGTLTAYQTSDWGLQLTNIDDQCSFQILYTSSDDKIVTPTSSATFGANIVSNTYENGQGIITFDGPVTKIGAEAFSYCKTLTSIVIPKYVNTIEYYAFSGCDALAEISVQEGNMAYDSRENCNAVIETATNTLVVGCKNTIFPSSVTCIGDFAFRANQSLTTIRIPEGITSIGTETFCACQSLSCIVLPETLNSIGLWAFYGCSSLTSIDIPKGVTTISEKAFKDCSSVDTINVYAENPPTLGYEAFIGTPSPICYIPCGTLAAYQASDWANQVGELVEECSEEEMPTNQIKYTTFDESILTIDTTYYTYEDLFGANIISNTYENGVGTITFDRPLTTIGNNAFGGSGYYLTSIKLPNTVTSIGSGAFLGCYYLTEFTIPENVTTIGRDAFSSCEALTEITIPKSVTSIEPQIFNRCPSLIKITIEEGNEKYDSRDNCNAIIETATNKLIEGCKTTIIPNTVTSIGESAFSGCENLSSITIPNSVTSIEVWAFAYCYALDAVFIDAIMPPTLIYNYTLYKYQVFSGKYPTCYVPCGTLAAYQASDWAKEGVTLLEKPCENTIPTNQIQYTSSDGNVITPNIGYMTEFDAFGANIVSNTYENGVGTITFDGAVSRIGYQSFSNSETLTSITLPDSISTIDFEAFRNCDRLKFVTIPNSVYGIWDYAFGECDSLVAVNIPASVEYIGSSAFESCYQLASVALSEGLMQIGENAFRGCSKLTSLSLPSTLQYLGQSAFSGCGFYTFTIPTGITSIPAYLFMYCQNLQSVIIHNNVTTIEDGAFSTCQKLTSIDIPNSVTSIGFGAFSETGIRSIILPENITTINGNTFYGCTNLTSITIPNKVTTIKESAFFGCTSLKSVSIPNSVTTIEGNVFYDCTSLEELYIPKSVTSITNYTFGNCESLKSIAVEDGNTVYDSRNNCNAIIESATNTLITGCQNTIIPKDVVSVGKYAFVGQKQLNLIAFPSSIQKIEYNAFADCSNLKTILFGKQVDSIAQKAFENCLAIDDIYSYNLQPPFLSGNALAYYDANLYVPCSALSEYQTADNWSKFVNVHCIDTMYFNITNDTVRPYTAEVTYGDMLYAGDVFIPALVMIDDEVYHVTSIGDSAFYNCSSLTSVSIPESVVTVDPNAFTNCTSLDTIAIKAITPPTLDNSGISSNPVCKIPCQTLSAYEASDWSGYVKNFEEQCEGYYIYYTSTDEKVISPYKTNVFHAKIISNKYENGVGVITFDRPVTRIGEMAFTDCRKLASITIPNTVLIIDDKAFYRCSSLVDITIPNSVKIIGSSAFCDCSSLTSITIPNSVTSIENSTFSYCSSLVTVTIPNNVVTIGNSAFKSCKNLISITIPNSVTSIGESAFSLCDKLTSIEFPNSVISIGNSAFNNCHSLASIVIPNGVNSIGSHTFYACSSLAAVSLPNGLTSIGLNAFGSCSSLISITIPNSVTVIDNQAFSDCSSLTAVTIGENVISIGGWAFDNCSSLISITIPNSVTNIGKYAFSDCDTLKTVYVEATVPPTLSGNIFYNTTPPTCHIPCGTLAAYQASDWANQVGELVEECEYEDLIPTNQIQYTTWDDEIVRIDTTDHIDYNYGVNYYSMFGANIISNTYENGVGTITFDAPVTTIGSRVFNNSNLRTIILPNSITTIQDDAFSDCGSLQSITLPRNLKSIGYGAFRMCSQLQSIEFPEGLESIEGRAFENCFNGMGYYATEGSYIEPNGGYIGSGLSISIPSSVTSIGEGVFAWCSGIKSFAVDSNNTTYDSRENCNAIIETATNTMISGCSNTFIPNSVTALGYGVFYGYGIKSINIPDGVVSIGESAFAYSSVDTLHIPSSVKTIGRMAFDHCDDLTTLTLSEGLETIEYAGIHCCYALKSIVFPSTLNSIGAYGVSSCTSMTSVEFLSTTPPTIDNNSYGCFWRTPCEFTVPCGTKDAYYTALNADAPSGYHIDSLNVREKDVFAYSIISGDIEQGLVIITKHATYCDDQTLSFYVEPAEGSSFVKWSDGCTDKERNITLTQDTTIVAEFSSMNCVIASGTCGINGDNLMWQLSCDSILSIMGEGEMSEYTYDDHGINPPWTEYASQIKSIVVKEGVTSIGTYAFFNYGTAKYSSLQDITIPASLTKTGGNVFSGLTSMNAVYITDLEAWMNISHSNSSGNPLCSAHHLYVNGVELEELVLPEGTSSVNEYVFYGCKGLKSLQLPNSIELIENSAFAGTGLIQLVLPEGLEVVDNSAFYGCLSLEKLYISSTVRRLGNCAFEGCDSLKGVYITDLEAWCNLTMEYSSPLIDAHHLYLNDIELTEVVFPENCSVVKNYTFEGCSYIKSIQLHDNITSIGSFAFSGCSSLESLVIPASVSYIGSCQFWDCTALKQIKFLSSTPPEISQGAVVFNRTNTDIIVPCGSKDEYIAVINSPDQELDWIDTNRIIEQQSYIYSITTSNPAQGTIYYLHEPSNCDDLTITFRADAANGYRFVRWSDGNTENPRTLLLTQDTYLTAEFETSVCNVNVWCDTTRGFVIGSGTYAYGTTITLSAHANEGYRFARWSDNITETPRTITLYQDITLRADFMDYSETNLTICESELPYIWYNQSLTATGKYTHSEQYAGTDIDSIQHILNLTVNPTVYAEETITACDSYTWNGETYTQSGEYVYTTTATNGCDSIVTLHLTINHSGVGATEYATICYGETYIWNGQTYSDAGEYSVTLSNTLGCDSVATLHLTIMPEAVTTTETVVVGSDELPYVWRGNTYSATGRYTDVEQYAAVACDSAIHVLDLTVLTTGNFDEQSVTICETETPYTWYGEAYSATGKYTYTEQYVGTDIDSIQHVLNLTVNPTIYTEEHITACDSYTWNGETYTTSGEYVYTTVATNGCDSIVTLHLTVSSTTYASEQATICYGDTYTWNGQTYATAGAYSITLQNANGCDSIVTLHLTVLPEVPVTIETATIYDGEEYIWHDESYFEEGEYSITLQNINGCDSVITLILTVLPIYENEWSLLQEIRDDLIQNNAWQTPWDLSTSVSSWRGVELYKGHVIEIDLSSQGLTGTFPTKILQLPHLEYLSLADNLLTGEAFAKMQTDMTTFVAENPTFLSALIYLDISYNQFTGNVGIIAAMSNFMPNLSFLQANNNRFRDVVPVIPQKINVDLSEQDINHYVHMDASELNIDPTQLPTIMLYDHVGQTYFTSPIAVDITNYSPDYTYSHDNPWGIMIDKTNDYMLCLNGDAYRGKNGDTLYLSYPYSEVSHYSYCRMTLSFEMGDANFVDGVNIADLQTTILYAFGEYNDCVFNFTAADTYTDNKINVQDVIRTVGILVANAINNTDSIMMNHIAPREQQSSADAEIFVDNNAIKVVTTRPIAALQINFKGNAQWKMNDLGMEQTATQHTVVAYSLTGNNIPVGETIIGYCQGNVDLLHAELSDADARLIPVTISGQRMPTATEDLQTTDNEQAIYDVLGRKHNQINQQGLYIIKSNNQYIKVFNYNK